MKANNYKPGKLKSASFSSRTLTTKRNSFNSNLSTNYELMLRLYLVNKEQTLSKDGLRYWKLPQPEKVNNRKEQSSFWNNITQVLNKVQMLFITPDIHLK